MNYRIVLIIILLIGTCVNSWADIPIEVSGVIRDKDTREPLPFVNIWIKGSTKGTMSDTEGEFILSAAINDTLAFSAVGYNKYQFVVGKSTQWPMEILLEPDVQTIGEVTVRPEESRAKVLLRQVVRNKKENRRKVLNYSDYNTFERTSVYMAIDSASRVNRFIPNMNEVTMKVEGQDFRFTPIYLAELGTQTINKTDSVVYNRKDGIFPKLNQTIESLILLNVVVDLDFYKDQINILGRGLVSPLSNNARLHYDFYLNDSTIVDSTWYYSFSFTPKNKYNALFTGRFTVEGKNYALTDIYAYVQEEANINFVNGYKSNVSYKKTPEGSWFYDEQEISLNLALIINKDTISKYGSQRIDQVSGGNWLVTKTTQYATSTRLNAVKGRDWKRQPEFATTLMSDGTYERVDKLKENSLVRVIDAIGGMVLTGYINMGKFELGPVFDIYSTNFIEGHRITLPIRTGEDMWDRFTIGGFIGYGTKNNEFQYGGNVGWQIKESDKFIIRAGYYSDYKLVSQDKYLNFIKKNPNTKGNGNFVAALTSRQENPYLKKDQLSQLRLEYNADENITGEVNTYYLRSTSTPAIQFVNNGINYPQYSNYGMLFNVRLAFGQYYDKYYFARVYYIDQIPVVNLSWDFGKTSIPGLNTPSFGFYSQFHGSIVGRLNMGASFMRYMLNAGFLFGDAPYDLLDMPVGSMSLGFAKYRFNLLHQASFAHNAYTNLHLDWVGGGILFNRLPLIRNLKLREMVSFKAHYGDRTSAYKPVFDLPQPYSQELTLPYAELGLGITNIFKVLRIEYIHLVGSTYMDKSFTDNSGIRFRAEMSF